MYEEVFENLEIGDRFKTAKCSKYTWTKTTPDSSGYNVVNQNGFRSSSLNDTKYFVIESTELVVE